MVFRSNNEENVRDRGLLIISLVFLLLGVGINEGLENLIATTTQNAFHKIGAAEKQPTASSKGIISFVHLVKKLKPVVVNISATQTSEEDQLPPSPFGENDELNEFWRRFFGNPGDRSLGVKRTDGVMITSVEPGSVADDAGLEEDDIIIEVNRKPIHDLPGYNKAVAEAQKGKGILFLIRRGENTIFVALKPQ